MTMTVDFSGENERPFYIGLAQTLTAPATILAPSSVAGLPIPRALPERLRGLPCCRS